MPLRDHFRPPVSQQVTWQEIHGMWPSAIIRQLHDILPADYVAGPYIHLGSQIEIDIAAYEQDLVSPRFKDSSARGAATTQIWQAEKPSVAVETELPDFDEYEVRIYDATRGRILVAAIELVSPANKDRAQSRDAFVAKCAALLRKGVAVSIVDLVTVRQFNLYAQLMSFIGHPDSSVTFEDPAIYAASCRWAAEGERARLESWPKRLTIGQPLPTIPLWLSNDLPVSLDLEPSYEQACRDLWLT